jgi:iron complex outermembrane recepter protein
MYAAVSASLAATAVDLALAAGDNATTVYELPTVEVVGTTPLPGIGIPREQVPQNVQSVNQKQMEEQHALELGEVLNQNLGSVNVNDTQGNPYQLDVNFRGLTASPVLGTPQGLSVFVDGVRVNEAFGDSVNWDLIPQGAIANINLVPGSNPVFGLNTLGGAVSINTKSGFSFPGTVAEVTGGSFGRRAFEFQSGDHGRTSTTSSRAICSGRTAGGCTIRAT